MNQPATTITLKYALAWIPMLLLAILNGGLREKLYGPRVSERTAHQISCATGILLFTLYTVWLGKVWPLPSPGLALIAGLIWLFLTVAFEFSMICLMQKMPLSAALAEYNVKAGRLWIFVLLAVAVLPLVVHTFSHAG